MAQDIKLETLLLGLSNLSEKRIFLYTNNPSQEPEYISINDLFNSIDANFNLTNKFIELAQITSTLEIHSNAIDVLTNNVNTIATKLGDIETSQLNVIADVKELKETVEGMVNDLATALDNSNTNRTYIDAIVWQNI